MSADDILIRVIQPHEYEQVVQFIIDYFIRDEPLRSTEAKFILSDINRANYKECILGGTSILAVKVKQNGEEELLGVNISVPKDPSFIEKYFEDAEKEGNTKYGQILKLSGIANRQADVFKRYGVDKLLYSSTMCIKPNYRGKNISTRLNEEFKSLGKKLGYKLITGNCTGFYSARLCKRMGCEVVNFIRYADYKDENGHQIFKPPAPHEGFTVIAMRL